MVGRPPKPAALKAIDGDKANIGATKHAEAIKLAGDIPKGIPDAPEGMSPRGRKVWDRYVNCAGAEKLFREADWAAMMAAFEIFASFEEAIEAGDIMRASSLIAKWIPLSDRLGLTPGARARLQLGSEDGNKVARPDPAAWKQHKAG